MFGIYHSGNELGVQTVVDVIIEFAKKHEHGMHNHVSVETVQLPAWNSERTQKNKAVWVSVKTVVPKAE